MEPLLERVPVFPVNGPLSGWATGKRAPDPDATVANLKTIFPDLTISRPSFAYGDSFSIRDQVKSLAIHIADLTGPSIVLCSATRLTWARDILSHEIPTALSRECKSNSVVTVLVASSKLLTEPFCDGLVTIGVVLGVLPVLAPGIYVAYHTKIYKAQDVISYDEVEDKLVLVAS